METSSNSREWEVRFDERFIPNDRDIPTYIENGNDLKDFIHQELQKAREEERKRIVDWLKQHGYYHEEHRALFETLQSELDQPII